jgi:peptidoglycan/xylan/chitin deacetylase (PgdA/CDA1 family)
MGLLRGAGKLTFAAGDVFLRRPTGPRILIYHRVGLDSASQIEVATEDFVWQLEWLLEHREIASLESALDRWNEPSSERLVVLSFDDGYADTYDTAFPLLKRHGLPFTLYLATAGVGEAGRLTWGQIEEMVASGLLTVGAHTHRHVDLRGVSEEQARDEMETSNGLIEQHAGVRPLHFAYPWGYWSARADGPARQLYESAMLGSAPAWGAVPHDRHMVYRYPVQLGDGRRWFPARLNGGLGFEESVRRRHRGYRGP